jgi:hypothetical protein
MATSNTWGDEESYYWVVICKNQKFHRQQNLYSGHKIPLGETDDFVRAPVSARIRYALNVPQQGAQGVNRQVTGVRRCFRQATHCLNQIFPAKAARFRERFSCHQLRKRRCACHG